MRKHLEQTLQQELEDVKRHMVELDGMYAEETPPLSTSASLHSSCSPSTTRPRDSFRISATLRRHVSEPTDLADQRRAVHGVHHSPIPGTAQMYRPGPTHSLPLDVLRRNSSEPDLQLEHRPSPLHGDGAIPRDFFKTLARSIRAERESFQRP